MTKSLFAPLAMATALFTAGCATLVPGVPEAEMGIATEWPLPATTATAPDLPGHAVTAGTARTLPVADIGWRDFLADPKLEALVETALANNRDLRVAILNVGS